MIESTTNKQVYTVTQRENPGVFAFPVRFWNSDEIVVAIGGTSTFSEVRLSGGTEFDVTGSDYTQGGTVTLHYGAGKLPALSAMIGKSVTVARELPLTQTLSLPTHGVLPSEELEGELDKIICIIQQHDEEINRCIKAPLGSGVSSDEYMQYFLQQLNLSVQSCVYSAESAAASAANSAAVAAFVGNCMTEITGNTSYAEKAAASFYNVEKQYGAVIASGTATLLAVTGDGLNAVTLAGQTATVALQQEGLSQQESIAGVGGTYTAKIAQAEGEMEVYLAGCTAAAAYAGTSAVEIQGMSTSLRQMKEGLDVSVAQALEAGTVCIVQAGSSSYYMQQSQAALRDAQAALSGCTTSEGNASASAASALSKAGEAATSASNALARAGEAAQSAANAHAAELAAGTVAEQTANSCITVHNASALAHQDIRDSITSLSSTVTAQGNSITNLSSTKASLAGGTFTGTVCVGSHITLSADASGDVYVGNDLFIGDANGMILRWDGSDFYLLKAVNGGWRSDVYPMVIGDNGDTVALASGGTVLAPTPPAGDNSTRIATTAFVLANGGATRQGKPNWSAAVDISSSVGGTDVYTATEDGWVYGYIATLPNASLATLNVYPGGGAVVGGTITPFKAVTFAFSYDDHDDEPQCGGISPIKSGDNVYLGYWSNISYVPQVNYKAYVHLFFVPES